MKIERFRMGWFFPGYPLVILVLALLCGSANAIPPLPVVLQISPMTFLSFSNLTTGNSYQMQQRFAWYWTNLPVSFTATSTVYTQLITGVAQNVNYRLALNPVPAQAFALAQVVNGSVVGATITDGGSGYVSAPAVLIVRGGGTNATATTTVSGSGIVTNIVITRGGSGYTNTPIVELGQPPDVAVTPGGQLVTRLNDINTYSGGWYLQFTPQLGAPWQNFGAVTSWPMDLFVTNNGGYYQAFYP